MYLLDNIDLSSFHKQGISDVAAHFYGKGRSLASIAQEYDVSKDFVRKTLKKAGVAIRPHNQFLKGQCIGQAPYGFAAIDGRLVKDPKEQQIVQRIMKQWRQGKTCSAIAQALNSQGVKPRTAKSWDHSTIKKIVQRYGNQK